VIRFSASLVVIAMGLLVAGGVTSKLPLVYAAIALSAVALIFLVIGAILNRGEFRAQPSGDPVPHRDAEPEPAALAGAAPAVNPATSPASLAGQARAAATDMPTDTATDIAPVGGTGKPPWPDSPAPAGRLRPDVPDEQWPGKRLPDEFHPHAPWPAQRPAPPAPANFDWLTPAKPRTSGATEAGVPNRPREQPSTGAVPPPPAEGSVGPKAEAPGGPPHSEVPAGATADAPAGPQAEAPAGPQAGASAGAAAEASAGASAGPQAETPAGATKPPLADAVKAPLADAIRELRAKTSEKPRAAAPGSAPPDAPVAPTQQLAAAQPAEPEPPKAEPAKSEAAASEAAAPEPPAYASADADAGSAVAVPAESRSAAPAPGESGAGESGASEHEPGEPVSAAAKPAGQAVTVVPGVPRYHRSDCILIRFMGDNDLQKMPVEAAREAGCTPCRACQPDGEDDG
jgi:hypothetical protein